MKKWWSQLLIIMMTLLLVACNGEKTEPIDWLADETGVYYQIFVRSFADSNQDGIGDINGITENLDYLKELGIKGIWLMPIFPSDSYHGYDVTDYYAIHSDYGTMEDFERLIAEANKKEIKIFLDLVLNHTSQNHPWFKEAKDDINSPYRDYYHWTDGNDSRTKRTTPDGQPLWHAYGDYYYASYFPGNYADLNVLNPKVEQELIEIGTFWLEKGVHGFRLDAAMHLFAPGKVSRMYDYMDGIYFWRRYQEALEEVNPNVYLVGEVWAGLDMYAQYYQGLDSAFNFEMSNAIVDMVRRGNGPYGNRINQIYDRLRDDQGIYRDAPFLLNHDMDRLASVYHNDHERLKLAAEMLLTLPGNPYIYYGEEIGMEGIKTEGLHGIYDETRRLPFPWGDSTFTSSWMDEACSLDGIACEQTNGTLKDQQEDEDSLYWVYHDMIHIRNEHPALNRGDIKGFNSSSLYIQGVYRYTNDQLLLVLHNLSNQDRALPEEVSGKLIYESKRSNHYKQNEIGKHSTIILELPIEKLETID